jgi:hypothetical protein
MNTTARVFSITAFALAASVPALPAMANDADVINRGGCSGATTWKLKASPEDGRIEVEGEIDSNRTGQTWSWRLQHNGTVSAKGQATTRGASGSFEVRRVVVNLRGADDLVFRAVNDRSGELCRGKVTF